MCPAVHNLEPREMNQICSLSATLSLCKVCCSQTFLSCTTSPFSDALYTPTIASLVAFQSFCWSVSLVGLSGAMSNIGIRSASASEVGNASAATNGTDEFHCFILEEMSRRMDSTRKRTSSNKDVIVDSPTRKRNRLL